MLTISNDQLDRLGVDALTRFRARLKDHLYAVFSRPCALAGDAAVDDLVERALERAAAHGLDTVATVQSFADHMVMLGWRFDEDPLYAALRRPLDDDRIESRVARLDRLHAETMAYRRAAEGEGAEALYRALARLSGWLRLEPEERLNDPPRLFERLFPEKAAALGERTVGAAMEAARSDAAGFGLEGERGLLVYEMVALMAGRGFLDDPLFVGATGAHRARLADAPDDEARIAILEDGVGDYLGRVLEAARMDAGGR